MPRIVRRPARLGRPALAAALAGLCLAGALAGCGAGDEGRAATGGGSTLQTTLVDRDGDGTLETGPGEPLVDRTELARARPAVRRLARLAVISDAHVRDAESPARVPFLDRLGDPFTSTFRPQETLAVHVLDASVRALNRLRPDAVLVTGDLVDNAQRNELDWAVRALEGGRVAARSGASRYEGVQRADNPDPRYWRPAVDAPRHPGLLARAQAPFEAAGLRAPWYPASGNHDLLVQGELPVTPAVAEFAAGGSMVVGLDPARELPSEPELTPELVDALVGDEDVGRRVAVTPDPARRPLDPDAAARALGAARGIEPRPDGRLDYVADVGPRVRAIVLDTTSRAGGARGEVLPAQRAWLSAQLAAAGPRRVVVVSHQPLTTARGGPETLELLDRDPRVIAVLGGHTHRHRIDPRPSPAGGYWLITTAALADHPQQARIVDVVETEGGGVALETSVVDHTGRGLAATARELAYLDAQGGRPAGAAGRRVDRNARLHLPKRTHGA